MIKLNLGCSIIPMPGYTNVDCRPLKGVDVVHDLNVYPWPWADGSVDYIHARNVLEHLIDPLKAIKEMSRILKPGGEVYIRVPHMYGPGASAVGHLHYFKLFWFTELAGGPNEQMESSVGLNCTSLKLMLVATSFWFKPLKLWAWFFNKNTRRQLVWESLGVLCPTDIDFTAYKPVSKDQLKVWTEPHLG